MIISAAATAVDAVGPAVLGLQLVVSALVNRHSSISMRMIACFGQSRPMLLEM